MYQIDSVGVSPTLPTPAAPATAGYFTAGNPATGTQATVLDADWFNAMMLELMNVVTGGGLTPTKGTNNQVLSAIQELIKAAGNNASGITTVTATGPLTPAVAGGTVIGNSASATIQTLPAASTIAPGGRIEFLNINTATMSVTRAGTDTVTVNNTAVTSLAVNNGDTLTLESNGSNGWYAVGGSVQLGYAAIMQASQSLASNGYRKFPVYPGEPSPLILQWGQVTCSTSGVTTANFPLTWPISAFMMATSPMSPTASGKAGASVQSTSQFNIASTNIGGTTFYGDSVGWMALGH